MKPGDTYPTKTAVKVLLIGESGSGKSNFCMDWPTPLFINYDGNLKNAVERHPGKKFFYADVDTDDAGKPLRLDQQWSRGMEQLAKHGSNPEVKTIVADGLSRMSELLQNYLVVTGGEAEKVISIGGLKVMNRSLWGPFAEHIRRYLRLAISFNKPFILTCHTKIDANELTTVKEQVPNVSGQIVSELAGWFTDYLMADVVIESDLKKYPTGARYVLRTAPTNRIKLKNSMGLPPVVDVDGPEIRKVLAELATTI